MTPPPGGSHPSNEPPSPSSRNGARLVTAVVLAGGTSRRFGAPDDDKLEAVFDGQRLLEHTIESVPPDWSLVVVVGPPRPLAPTRRRSREVTWLRESPPGGGPASAVTAAAAHVDTPWMAILAGDTPRGGRALPHLLDAAINATTTTDATATSNSDAIDGTVALVAGRRQPLLAVYRTAALLDAAAVHPTTTDLSMRRLLAPLHLLEVGVDERAAQDVDTLADLARLDPS